MTRQNTIITILLLVATATSALAQRGGFDPSQIIEKIDRNKNGIFERDEVDGRGESWIKRYIPDADFEKGVSTSKFRQLLQKEREQREREQRDRDDRKSREREEKVKSTNIESGLPAALVLGFGEEVDLPPVINFGSSSESYIKVTDANRERARITMQRYDRNKDGYLDEKERNDNRRWFDDPMQYDANRDGKISTQELSVRYAYYDRRKAQKTTSDGRDGRDRDRRDRDRGEDDGEPAVEVVTGTKNRSTYGTAHDRLPDGLPEWFAEKDADQDGQLSMAEFLAELNPEKVAEFTSMDTDNNGVINPAELGVETSSRKEGLSRRTAKSESRGDSSQRSRDSNSNASAESSSKTAKTPATAAAKLATNIDEKYMKYATGRIKQYDANRDGVLSIEECKAGKPGLIEADLDKNGKITADEVASFYQRLYKR